MLEHLKCSSSMWTLHLKSDVMSNDDHIMIELANPDFAIHEQTPLAQPCRFKVTIKVNRKKTTVRGDEKDALCLVDLWYFNGMLTSKAGRL